MSRTERTKGVLRGLATVAAALVIVACASATKTALKQAATASSTAIAAGDYGKALDAYQKIYEKNRANGRVVSSYTALIEEVKAVGGDAENQGNYAKAQGIYGTLAGRWDGFSALGRRLSFKKADLEAGIKDCRLALCERQFRQEIGTGNYVKALGAYQAALKDHPGDAAVKKRYTKGIAEVAAVAAKALAAKDYGSAGRIEGLLLRLIDTFEGEAGKAAEGLPTRESLNEAIRECSIGLTNGGLTEYRKGNLEGAIAIWDELLTFDPGNAEIKKAVETAKAQLGKLKVPGRGSARTGRVGREARGSR